MDKQVEEYIRLADKNLADSIRLQIKSVDTGEIYETDNYMIYTVGAVSTDAHLNGALCFDDKFSAEMMEKADEFFNKRKLDYTVWVRDHGDFQLEEILKSRGLSARREPGSAVMAIEERIREALLPDGFIVKGVNTREDIENFSLITAEAFEKSPLEIDKMYQSESSLIDSNIIAFVIYDMDNKPVSAVMTVLSDEVAGIYWVGTAESARGKGLGSFVTQIATNSGFDSGKNLVILQASEAGERVYKRLGYQTITRYRTYPIKITN